MREHWYDRPARIVSEIYRPFATPCRCTCTNRRAMMFTIRHSVGSSARVADRGRNQTRTLEKGQNDIEQIAVKMRAKMRETREIHLRDGGRVLYSETQRRYETIASNEQTDGKLRVTRSCTNERKRATDEFAWIFILRGMLHSLQVSINLLVREYRGAVSVIHRERNRNPRCR